MSFLLAVGSVWGGASDECIEVASRISHGTIIEPLRGLRLLLAVRRRSDAQIAGAARRMEDANGSVVCTPRRRFEQAQRRATAIAKHVDARAGASRSEEAARDEGMAVTAFASQFARRAVADAVAAR